MAAALSVTTAVEGITDEAVVRRVAAVLGFEIDAVYATKGKGKLDKNLGGYNSAARFHNWWVVRDLDSDAECAPELVAALLPEPAERMCFRIAVRAIESWLIADRESLSAYLRVPVGAVPESPDTLADPKEALVNIARRSRSASIRREMVPEAGTSASVGKLYSTHVVQYASSHWRPRVAASVSTSLAGCLSALDALLQ